MALPSFSETTLPGGVCSLRQTVISSGIADNFDVTFEFEVENTGTTTLTNLSLVDDWATQFGANFVGIVPGGVTVTNVDAATVPGANATYAGGATENLLDGTGTIESGKSFLVLVTVEVDPDADPSQLVTGELLNSATATGTDPAGPTTVSDISDDPTDLTENQLESDNDPDDTTAISISEISLEKTNATPVAASSGIEGNVDVVYTFVISNSGTADLTNLTLFEDIAAQR